jgi:hypothetical protein
MSAELLTKAGYTVHRVAVETHNNAETHDGG